MSTSYRFSATVLALAFLLLPLAVAQAGDPSFAAADPLPAKSEGHVGQNPAEDGRQGGESIADAVPITSLPFGDTGATCDNVDDYDETCPYTGSTSPDVVYSYSPPAALIATIDLCGSLYDTKVYVYDSALNVVACNDDAYYGDPCGLWVSRIDGVHLDADEIYYIVIDGYGGDCGEYALEVTELVPCELTCPSIGEPEGEPPLHDDYDDTYNGGCDHDSDDPALQELWGTGDQQLVLCGISGWYDDGIRDTDWFAAILDPAGDGTLTVEITAEMPSNFHHMAANCYYHILQESVADDCVPSAMTVEGDPGEVVWFVVFPTVFDPPSWFVGHEYAYILNISGLADAVVTVEPSTWTRVKDLYRSTR